MAATVIDVNIVVTFTAECQTNRGVSLHVQGNSHVQDTWLYQCENLGWHTKEHSLPKLSKPCVYKKMGARLRRATPYYKNDAPAARPLTLPPPWGGGTPPLITPSPALITPRAADLCMHA